MARKAVDNAPYLRIETRRCRFCRKWAETSELALHEASCGGAGLGAGGNLRIETRTCRFCRKWAETSELVKYSVRSYAHPLCLLEGRGVEAIRSLPSYQLGKIPVLPMRKRGVDVMQMWIDAQGRENAPSKANVESE